MIASQTSTSKRLLISPGYRRCATSSLHTFLQKNRELLSPYFQVYTRGDLTKRWRSLINEFHTKDKSHALERFPERAREIAASINWGQSGNAIIADENLIAFRLVSPKGRTMFDAAAAVLPFLEKAFQEVGVEVSFRFQIRDWEDYVWSCYSREVSKRGSSQTFDEYAATVPPGLNWETGNATVTSALSSPVRFVHVKDDLISGLPGRSVMEHFGVPDHVIDQLVISKPANISPSREQIEKIRQENQLAPPMKEAAK